ncbi:protein of unknown function (plasmid) [Cupriavidus taiwanensis]|uniref:Uncharacterized protein n=1 Tax=Cupriavidus taiwanensis TaxID=164546 RepID=A0A375IR80_9BURK|nr:protein of unknown function [Cupriavidus taiwanensis]
MSCDMSSRRLTSVHAHAHSPRALAIRSASPRSRCSPRAPSTTFAPRSASSSAAASPIPLLAPVMTTTLSLIVDMIFSSSLIQEGGNHEMAPSTLSHPMFVYPGRLIYNRINVFIYRSYGFDGPSVRCLSPAQSRQRAVGTAGSAWRLVAALFCL